MYDKILVPIDGSSTANAAVAHAQSIAELCNSQVRIFHALDFFEYTNGFERPSIYSRQVMPAMIASGRAILNAAQQAFTGSGIVVESHLEQCSGQRAAQLIVRQSQLWGASLIIMGTHGRRGFNRLLMGSDAELVVRSATMPVLLIKAHHNNP